MRKKRMGRPPLPKKQRKDALVSARITLKTFDGLKEEADSRGMKVSALAAEILTLHVPVVVVRNNGVK